MSKLSPFLARYAWGRCPKGGWGVEPKLALPTELVAPPPPPFGHLPRLAAREGEMRE